MKPRIEILRGDITKISADCIVNAANSSLMGGGGVDGAIHRAAGPMLLEECKKIRREQYPNGLPIGRAVATKSYGLAKNGVKYIIHTVGPRAWRDNIELLKDCYINSLMLAEQLGCKSIAFPAISTGAYGVSIEDSARIVRSVLKNYESGIIERIMLVLWSERDYEIYKKELGDLS
ncbi:macro domain-containing protein [Candidatus Woesearchaeota archaeon]|nr:macro domain-containing protein [Candidatus Woesearchaeota archaeon]